MKEPVRFNATSLPANLLTNDGAEFQSALEKALNFESRNPDERRPIFAEKSVVEWEEWAKEFDLPIVAVKQ